MCRLFGFRSILHSPLHNSLLSAENALGTQSVKNPDGWGISYYLAGTPHVIKSTKTAMEDSLFQKVSGIVTSDTLLAHVRAATHGETSILNAHPFQYGHWTFAHNGNVKNFEIHREKLKSLIPSHMKRFLLGSTDSEIIFFIFLGFLNEITSIEAKECSIDSIIESVERTIKTITDIIGPYQEIDDAENSENFLTFIVTNGKVMLAHQGGKNLYYSTHKNSCPEEKSCQYYNQTCINEVKSGQVNHLIFASEPTNQENIWKPMNPGDIISVDSHMNLHVHHFKPF